MFPHLQKLSESKREKNEGGHLVAAVERGLPHHHLVEQHTEAPPVHAVRVL
jgi:hypothetical protein